EDRSHKAGPSLPISAWAGCGPGRPNRPVALGHPSSIEELAGVMFIELSVHGAGAGKRRAVLVNADDVTDVELVAAGNGIRLTDERRLVVDEPLGMIRRRFEDTSVPLARSHRETRS